jgi:zinc transporter ZupT
MNTVMIDLIASLLAGLATAIGVLPIFFVFHLTNNQQRRTSY